MKKSIWILSLVICISLCAFASAEIIADGTCGATGDNLTWTLDDQGVLTISGEGEMQDFSGADDISAWRAYRTSVKSISFSGGITYIGDYAFNGFSSLNSRVTIPTSVTNIGSYVFDGL